MDASCLSYFTVNHSRHDKQWLQKGNQFTLVCFVCLVEIIENKNEPSIKKTKVLQELLKLVSSGAVLTLLSENENVLSHLLNCLWNLMEYEENKLNAQNITVVEVIYQLCCALKSEVFVEKVMVKLSSKLVSTENVMRISTHLNLLGKIIQSTPGLIENLTGSHINLINHLGKWTSYPDENTRSSLFFILTHFYRYPQCCAKISSDVTDLVFRECCEVLTTATSKELQINSIALLQSSISKENFSSMSKLITSNMDKIITCLKKAFLSPYELVQTIATGCLNNLVQFDEQIISTDIPGFVFEVFTSQSDTLLSAGLQSISRLLDNKEMYTKGHVVYGFDAMVSALIRAADTKSIKVLRQGFDVIRKMFENCPRELVLISSQEVLKKCLDAITKGLSSCDDIFLKATSCLSVVIDRRHYGCVVPYDCLGELLEIVLKRLEKVCQSSGHWSRNENKDLRSSTISAILKVINKSLDLVISGRSEPPSIEALLTSTEGSLIQQLEEFFNSLLNLCDQICIPNIISKLRNFYETTIPEIFFNILNKLLQTCHGDSKEMGTKFASSCFIRIALETKAQHLGKSSSSGVQEAVNGFLATISLCLLPNDMREYAKNILSSFLQRVNGTALELLQVLKQSNSHDETLRNTQECILILFHLAYSNCDRLTPRNQLLNALSTFLVLNPTCFCESSMVFTHCLTQLYIRELHREGKCLGSSTVQVNAQRILAQGFLRNINNLSVLYLHDLSLLEWTVVFPDIDPDVRKEIIMLWFSYGGNKHTTEHEISFWKKMVNENPRTLLMLVSILSTADVHSQGAVLEVIQHVLQSCNMDVMQQALKELKLAMQKLFLNQAVQPLANENMKSIIKLLCLLVTTCSTKALDEDDIKLVYHIVNFLTHLASSSDPRSELYVQCLNFLNACVVQDTNSNSDKVLVFLLNHLEYTNFLEKTIQSFQSHRELDDLKQSSVLSTVLLSIAQLLRLQNSFGIASKNVISIKIEAVLPWLSYSSSPSLQLAANIFWESVIRCLQSVNTVDPVLVFEETTDTSTTEESVNEIDRSRKKISKVYLRMILVYLQNALFHVNMLIKLTALRCMEALFSWQEHNDDLIQDPWNISMLREIKDLSTPTSLGITMRIYSLFLRYKRLKSLRLEIPIKDVTESVLEQTDVEVNDKVHSIPELYLSVLPRFFREIILYDSDMISKAEKLKLKDYADFLLENYQRRKNDEEHGSRFVYLQEMLVYDELIQGRMNIQGSLNELVTILD